MQIIRGLTDFKIEQKSAVAIGKFDGIHKGHQELLSYVLKQKEKGRCAVVFTFDKPAGLFFKTAGEKELTPIEEKRRFFEKMGIDIVIEFPLNKETASIPAEAFVRDVVSEKMNAAYIAAGSDLSFGAGGRGNSHLLETMSGQLGYEVCIIEKIFCEGREISSSLVREEVEKGNMENVAKLLGRAYEITGSVQNGKRLGRKLGMPTINLYPGEDKLLPPNGVYYSYVTWEDQKYRGITNVGLKPTVNDTLCVNVETYLYDFDGDLYGEEVTISLLHYKRPEMKFESVDALKNQMRRDLEDGIIYHNTKS